MTSQTQVIDLGYKPRRHQDLIHRSLRRFNVLVCHRRLGKTVLVINEITDKGLRCELHRPQYAYIAPTYAQAKRVAWEMLKEILQKIPGVKINESELRVDIPRPDRGDFVRIMLLSADNPGSLRGIYLDGVALDEYAECDPTIWGEVVRPALSDRKGWAIFIGTPKGANHFYDLYQKAVLLDSWFTCILRASETKIIDAEELESAKESMTEEEFDQEYECSFSAALVGAYYGKILNEIEAKGQICSVPYDRNAPVDTHWDLGIGDTNVIWFTQSIAREYHVIDYYEMASEGLDHYVKMLNNKGYLYREHNLPHDANSRELGTGKTRIETLTALKLPKERLNVVPKQALLDGIHAVRTILPNCFFDKVKCARGIEALKNYQRKWDAKNKIFLQKPLHNWASHGADAFRTFAMGVRPEAYRANHKTLPRQANIETLI